MPVIFQDIDGVMLPARAYALPENFRRHLLIGTPGHTGDLIDCLPVDFDPIAVALVIHMAALSGARIVLHSDWRRHYEKDVLRGHVIRQGLDEARRRRRRHRTSCAACWGGDARVSATGSSGRAARCHLGGA